MNYPRLLALSSKRIRGVVNDALETAGVDVEDVGSVVMTNLKRSACHFVVAQAGLPVDRLFDGTLADVSHAFAMDTLINLCADPNAARSKFVLMVNLSPYSWAATVLAPVAAAVRTDRPD
jgi:hypothetical protein